jgi:hypothetical protein
MLAREGQILQQGKVISNTPLLIPSFSSKGFSDLRKTIKYMSSFIDGSTLVSAYDIHYKKIAPARLTFPKVVFLDSGGYEARVEHDLSEAYGQDYDPQTWTIEFYEGVLAKWKISRPTIAVSFDNPTRHSSLARQISTANKLFKKFPGFIPELLIKPRRKGEDIPVDEVVAAINELQPFAIVGFTERELGPKVMERMIKIATIRKAMDAAGLKAPIHIFGSLDTLSTSLYFVAGAEIFDGLTWLRFGYSEGRTIYAQNYGAMIVKNGILQDYRDLSTTMWIDNYYYLEKLRTQMINFARGKKFTAFEFNAAQLEGAHKQLMAQITKEV